MQNTEPLCIYHPGCADGSAAAAVFLLANPSGQVLPGQRKSLPPDELLVNRDVYVVDFSYSLELTLELKGKCRNLVILDHHETANSKLGHLPYFVYRPDVSGAIVAWDFFFPGRPVPKLLSAISDADTWQWKLADTQSILDVLETLPEDPAAWTNALIRSDDPEFSNYISESGDHISPWKSARIAKLAASKSYMTQFEGHTVPAICSSIWKSELGAVLAANNPFAIIYDGSDGSWSWSLRSTDAGIDVRAIAEKHGGGGHRNAASFYHTTAPAKLKPAAAVGVPPDGHPSHQNSSPIKSSSSDETTPLSTTPAGSA